MQCIIYCFLYTRNFNLCGENLRHISDEELIQFNRRGWIPGPDESEGDYLKRIEIIEHHFSYPPLDLDDFLTDGDWENAREITTGLFDFSLDWALAYYSNRDLPFFQGAATWLLRKEGVEIPLIQLKKAFKRKIFCCKCFTRRNTRCS